jgi:hypothetical protein
MWQWTNPIQISGNPWSGSSIVFNHRPEAKPTPYFNMSGITSTSLYVLSDARIIENKSYRAEILITSMVISGTDQTEERIAVLERKMQAMEPLVKGLIAELLDFKAVAMTMSREAEERSRQELKHAPVVSSTVTVSAASPADGSVLIHQKGARPADVPAEPVMVRIMQNDGTMKMEQRYGGDIASSAVGYGRTKKGTFATEKQSPLIYAADKDKSESSKKWWPDDPCAG